MSNETADLVLKQYNALLNSFLQYPAAQIYDFGGLSDDLLATSKGCSLEKMSMSLASKEILRQNQYHSSDKYTVVSVDTGKVLPLLGVGELHSNIINTNSKSPLVTYYTQNSRQISSKTETRVTDIYARMLSSNSLKVVPSIESISEEKLYGDSGNVMKILKSAYGGVTDVFIYNLRNPKTSEQELTVVFEAKKERSGDLIEVKHAVESQIQSIFTAKDTPVRYVTLDNVPRTGGKIDVAALDHFLTERASSEYVTSSKEQPTQKFIGGNLYKDLREIYSRLSSVPIQHIQPETSIFQLGFDSITAIQISSQMRSRGRYVPAATILENPTIGELTKIVERDCVIEDPGADIYDFNEFENQFWSSYAKDNAPLQEDVEVVRPCTHMQEGLLSQFLNSSGRKYFNHFEYISSTEIDKAKLCHAWEEIVTRHPILRTGFIPLTNTDHCFAMVVYRAGSNKIPIEIPSGTDFHCETQFIWAQSADAILNNFHLPPWRVILSFKNGKASMNIFALHALYDAHSVQIILDDLDSAVSGNELKNIKSFDRLLGKLLSNSISKENLAEKYWRSVKDNIIVSAFPVLTTTREKTYHTYTIHRAQSQNSTSWNRACRKANATTQAVAQAAWSRLLAAYLGVQDVTFGVVLSGRTDDQDQDVAFPCISTVPFSANVQRSDTELLQLVMSWNKDIIKYQHAPLTKIQRWIGRPNENLFDTVLVYQKSLSKPDQVGSWGLANEMANTEVRKF